MRTHTPNCLSSSPQAQTHKGPKLVSHTEVHGGYHSLRISDSWGADTTPRPQAAVRILPGGPTKEMRKLLRLYEKGFPPQQEDLDDGWSAGRLPHRELKQLVGGWDRAAAKSSAKEKEKDSAPPPPSGMSDDELIAFNPILAKAFAAFAARNDNAWRTIVAAAIRTGASPEIIYAMIKTGRMLTEYNMKFLSEEDIKEWSDAAEEYRRLVGSGTQIRKEQA
jgi:hypothetical protein